MMDDFAILELQAQVMKLSKKIAQMKNVLKMHPCFDDISLDNIVYLRHVQTLEGYFEAKGCSHEESFLIATQKH